MRYTLVPSDATTINGTPLFRIKTCMAFTCHNGRRVEVDDIGGFVESMSNLDRREDSTAWIFDDASVCEYATVSDDAIVCNHSIVRGHADVRDYATIQNCSSVSGHAVIRDNACISGYAQVLDHAVVSQNAGITHRGQVGGHTIVSGNAVIAGTTVLMGAVTVTASAYIDLAFTTISAGVFCVDCNIISSEDYFVVGPIGRRSDNTTFVKYKDSIFVTTGCYMGFIDDFEKRINIIHRHNDYHRECYKAVIALARIKLEVNR